MRVELREILLRDKPQAFLDTSPSATVPALRDGDKVIVRARFSGTHQGEFMDIPGTGKRFDIAVIDIIEFRDGKGVAHWGVMDMAGMMEQLGVGGPPA